MDGLVSEVCTFRRLDKRGRLSFSAALNNIRFDRIQEGDVAGIDWEQGMSTTECVALLLEGAVGMGSATR